MMTSNKILTSVALLAAAAWIGVPAAMAGPMTCTSSAEICISVGTTGNVVANSTTGAATAVGSYTGGWVFTVSASGDGFVVAPDILDSNTVNAEASSSGSLTVYVTETGLTSPLNADVLSSLTSNTLPAGWTVSGQTYFDTTNTAYGEGTPLSSLMLSSIGGTMNIAALSATGMYSLTEIYTITAPTSGNSNDTLNVSAVPEPATLALFGAGLLGCALVAGRRRRGSRTRI